MICNNCIHQSVCMFEKTNDGSKEDCEYYYFVKTAKWKINCDGYYPYCSNCYNEPKSRIMTKYCDTCGARMIDDK